MKLCRVTSEPGRFYALSPAGVVPLSAGRPPDTTAAGGEQAALLQRLTSSEELGKLANEVERCAADGGTIGITARELAAPIAPTSFRDFYAFEQHVRNARKKRGFEMPPEWFEAPVFYFSNTACIVGPGTAVNKPSETNEMDFELEIAAIVGRAGSDIAASEADAYIAGFTILNDWSARDVQRREMKVGLGPAKGKDFATSIGPYLTTPDELAYAAQAVPNRGLAYNLTMTARVNGWEYSRGTTLDMHWTFAELLAEASRNTVLCPGDLIGSGTVGTGCITEFPDGTHPWLQPGDVVELEIEGLGVLRSAVT